MKQYLVKVKSNLPYPIEKEYRVNCSSIATASQRGMNLFRKDVSKKKINEVIIRVSTIATLKEMKQEEPATEFEGELREIFSIK